ncbi:MAG TPA: type II toxin-antitoxin system CcdA family antitoxin [Solirubrobacteraceae bacterium]|nr:type II toxin-antitoxin system CcdA family antitoxin [Solirubrobacteraceae bacterium]
MARVNVYLPDELALQARAAGLNISKVTQAALSSTLADSETNRWLDRLDDSPAVEVPHSSVIQALDEARAELGEPGEPASS